MVFDRRTIALGVIAALGFPLGGCGGDPPETLRYRMTIEVETPEGVRTGSTVVQIWLARSGGFGGPPYGMNIKGEAIVLDLGARGLLFATLGGERGLGNWELIPERVLAPALGIFPHVTNDDADRIGVFRRLSQLHSSVAVDVPQNMRPLLVRFRDIRQPETAEHVPSVDVASVLGPGFHFKRAFVELTTDPMTIGIAARLPWIEDYYGKRLDGQRNGMINPPGIFANSLSSGQFKAWR